MPRDAGALPECEVKTLMIPDHTAIQERSSGYGQTGLGPSFWKRLNTRRQKKAPDSLLAALHGAPRMHQLLPQEC